MTNPDYDLTFGVKLEFVFVFHEKLILGQLKKDYVVERGGGSPLHNGQLLEGDDLAQWGDLFLRKDLTAGMRQQLRQGSSVANPEYLSWGIRTETSPGPPRQAMDRFEGVQSTLPPNEGVRTYATEPLDVAREVIRSDGAFDYWISSRQRTFRDVNFYDGTREQKPLTESRLWHFTNEFSLSALSHGALETYLRSYKVCPRRDGVRQFTNNEVPMNILKTGGAVPKGFKAPKMVGMIDFDEPPPERMIHSLNEISERSSKKIAESDQATMRSSRLPRESTLETGETTEKETAGSSKDPRESTAETTGETTEEEAGGSNRGSRERTAETTEEEAGPYNTALGKRSRSSGEDDDKENRPRPRIRGSGSTDKIKRSQLGYSPLTLGTGGGAGQTGTTASNRRETPEWEGPPYLGKRRTGLPDLGEWDSYGIKLVSPILDVGQPAVEEIDELCNMLKGEPCHDHGATINTTCGLHIHLKPRNADFDLPTLKHLAYILVMYERQIETLHPQYRRTNDGTGRPNFDRQSNIDRLVFGDVDRRSLREIRQLIATVGDFQALEATIGCGKGSIVKFSNLFRLREEDGPKTLEFRQHEGVLRGEMVGWWMYFCVGLLHLAIHMAHNGMTPTGVATTDFEAQCRAYPFQEWDEKDSNTDIRSNMSVWDLFDLMKFPLDGRRYFQRRAAYFAPDYDGRRPIPAPADDSTNPDAPFGPSTAGASPGPRKSAGPGTFAGPGTLSGPRKSVGPDISAARGTLAASSTMSGPDTALETLVPGPFSGTNTAVGPNVSPAATINTQALLYPRSISPGNSAALLSLNLPETIPETPGASNYTSIQMQNTRSSSADLPETIPETP